MVPRQGQQRDFTLKSVLKGWARGKMQILKSPSIDFIDTRGFPSECPPRPMGGDGHVYAHMCTCVCMYTHVYARMYIITQQLHLV